MLDEKEWENTLDDSESKSTGLTSLVEKNKKEQGQISLIFQTKPIELSGIKTITM